MTETADELRKRLKDARTAASELARTNEPATTSGNTITIGSTSRDTVEYSPDFSSQDQRNERPVPRLHNGVRGTKRTANDVERKLNNLTRSLAQINQRERQPDRRSSQDNSQNWPDGNYVPASLTGRTAGTRRLGNLETDEPVPQREFDTQTEATATEPTAEGTTQKRKRGRPPKQRDPEPGKPTIATRQADGTYSKETYQNYEQFDKAIRQKFLSSGKVLSKTEAKELQEPLVAALTDELGMIDKLLWSYTNDPLQQPIWSDISEKEMESLTNILLKLGQKSPAVATVTRTAVDGSDYVIAATLIGPRFNKTVEVIRDTRRKNKQHADQNRQSRFERVRASRRQTT